MYLLSMIRKKTSSLDNHQAFNNIQTMPCFDHCDLSYHDASQLLQNELQSVLNRALREYFGIPCLTFTTYMYTIILGPKKLEDRIKARILQDA